MIPHAGDELTEVIVHKCLVEFKVAEKIKRASLGEEDIVYDDIMGLPQTIKAEEARALYTDTLDRMTKEIADKLLHKLLNMRIFEDENGKTNLALKDVSGELLMISQFTLYANCKKGNRPSFTDAGRPEMAEPMYDYILEACRKEIPVVEQGEFGADMKVALVNDGPFTVVLDSRDLM